MLELNNVSKTFSKGASNEVHAIADLSLTVKRNEYLVLIGSNGSGKSTLLNLISGALMPDKGKVEIDNKDVTALPEYKRSKWISRVFQDPTAGTASGLTVIENFRMAAIRSQAKGLKIGTNKQFRESVKENIATLNLGLENKVDMLMGALSGGQRQALTLLMAVMDETSLLLMDEPASALDPKTAQIVMKIADELIKKHQLTAVLVTHNLRDALSYGSRLINLLEGKIINDMIEKDKNQLKLETLYQMF